MSAEQLERAGATEGLVRVSVGIEVEVNEGSLGQFDVLVGDEVVVSKTGGGLLSRLLGRGEFPDENEAVAAVKARLHG